MSRFISPHGVLVGTGGVLPGLGGMHKCIKLYCYCIGLRPTLLLYRVRPRSYWY
ncbi:hypothetical protein F383_15192 [Gossypium arboreum]|uniref:Uncharacterized protein n=1 Tax=Gossypium arboreum TaxID=29729 RepID=A0A0B0PZ84_GOSAR|nr:hypothetical protein F383_15192 [Gossypium arboreum]